MIDEQKISAILDVLRLTLVLLLILFAVLFVKVSIYASTLEDQLEKSKEWKSTCWQRNQELQEKYSTCREQGRFCEPYAKVKAEELGGE